MKINSKIIVFDFDGVIVDSEKIYYAKWKEASEFYNISLTHESLLSLRSACKEVASLIFSSSEEFEMVRALRRKLVNEYIESKPFELKRDIKEAFIKLKEEGYLIYIASSSLPELINYHLRLYGLEEYITNVLTVHGVKRGKPFPDIYLNICEMLKVNPKDVLAVEDSPNGVKSAHSAGLRVCMIPDQSEPDEELLEFIDVVCKTPLDIISNLE